MNKKKMILTSLASVAVLGATFVASQPSVVKADDKPTATQPTGETKPTPAAETPKTEVEKAKEAEKEAGIKVFKLRKTHIIQMFKKLDNMRFIVERFILNILLKLCLCLASSDLKKGSF